MNALPSAADAFVQAVATWYEEVDLYDYSKPGTSRPDLYSRPVRALAHDPFLRLQPFCAVLRGVSHGPRACSNSVATEPPGCSRQHSCRDCTLRRPS